MKVRMIGLVNPAKAISESGVSRVCEVHGVTSTPSFLTPEAGLSCLMYGGSGIGIVMRNEMTLAGGEMVMVEIVENVATGSASGRTQSQVASAMSLDDLHVNEILRTSQMTKDLRERCVEIISTHFKDNDTFAEMSADGSIVTDLGLNRFIRKNPSALDVLHSAPEMQHLKAIVYDAGADQKSSKVVVMYRFDEPEVRVLGRPNIQAILPEHLLSEDALQAQRLIVGDVELHDNDQRSALTL